MLKTIGSVATEGVGPRFISLDPGQRFLYAANEVGGSVVTYHVDHKIGHLTPTGQKVSTPSPVYIAFLTETVECQSLRRYVTQASFVNPVGMTI